MGYTPKFKEILAKVESLHEAQRPISEIQEYFKESVKNLGQEERLNNLYRIRPKRAIPGTTSRTMFFKLNRMQEDFIRNKTNRNLILKMRQGGVTTLSCLMALDNALWIDGSNSAIMAHVQSNVKEIFKITKTAFDWFQRDWGALYPVTRKTDNVNQLTITETGGNLIICYETKGLTLDFLHISEACFVEDSRISESLESVPLSGCVILESTPDSTAGLFYDIWEMLQKGQSNPFKAHFYPWWWIYPEAEDLNLDLFKPSKDFQPDEKEAFLMKTHDIKPHQILWRRSKIAEAGGDDGEFERKYPEDPLNCFLAGSRSVFSPQVMLSVFRKECAPSFTGRLVMDSQ